MLPAQHASGRVWAAGSTTLVMRGASMSQEARPRVPIKPGFYTVPDDPNEPPKFLASRCNAGGEHFYPRRAICGRCMSENMREVELDARGTVYSYTFVHLPLFGSTNLEHLGGYGGRHGRPGGWGARVSRRPGGLHRSHLRFADERRAGHEGVRPHGPADSAHRKRVGHRLGGLSRSLHGGGRGVLR